MEQPPSGRAYRVVIIVLALVALVVLIVIGAALVATRPPTAAEIAATLTALPSPTPTSTPTPTPIPTVPAVNADLLVCQREAGRAMNARGMVGTANISGDHQLLISWLSTAGPVRTLDDALPGVVLGFDVALEIWERGCAVYDRVRVDVHDGPPEQRVHRLTVRVPMDDLLQWRAGTFGDQALIARLEVTPSE
jgi:hypothetical protein